MKYIQEKKSGTRFWRCWRSKFEFKNRCNQVEDCVDADTIANKFASHFMKTFLCNKPDRAETLKQDYLRSHVD